MSSLPCSGNSLRQPMPRDTGPRRKLGPVVTGGLGDRRRVPIGRAPTAAQLRHAPGELRVRPDPQVIRDDPQRGRQGAHPFSLLSGVLVMLIPAIALAAAVPDDLAARQAG